MNIFWYEQYLGLEALIHSYQMLATFHGGSYGLSDEEEEDVSNWRSLLWERISELTEELKK